MRIRPAITFIGLVLVTGCAAEEPQRQPLPEPRPDRALVSWSETVCTQAKALDDLREGTDSPGYAGWVRSEVSTVLTRLDALEDSGIRQADDYVGALVRDLERLRDELSAETSGELAPSRIVELLDGIGRQEPELVALAERTKDLAPSMHLAPGCPPPDQPPTMDTLASRDLVNWANTMCRARAVLAGVPSPDDDVLKHPRFAAFEDSVLASYLGSVSGELGGVGEPVAGLPDIGVPAADTYRSTLLSALREAERTLPRAESPLDYYDLPLDRLRARAREVAETVSAIEPRDPDLGEVVREDPALSAAHDLAPNCEPPGAPSTSPTPLPAAEDGTDVAACEDGECRIEVSTPVDIPVRDAVFTATVSKGTVWLADDSGLIRLTGAGTGRFGRDDLTVTFSVIASSSTAAVLDVTTE
jgi:hypothetical protein